MDQREAQTREKFSFCYNEVYLYYLRTYYLRTTRTFRAEFALPAVVIVEREVGDSML